jgi:hypothetical protein
MGVVAAEGKGPPPSQSNFLAGKPSVQENVRHSERSRRDPFKRIKKPLPTPRVSKKSQSELPIGSGVKNVGWQLLGVIHGLDGHQAVIRISPKERVVLQPGAELARSGWTVKTIRENDVILEHESSTSSSGGVASPPSTFILSFPASRKSP